LNVLPDRHGFGAFIHRCSGYNTSRFKDSATCRFASQGDPGHYSYCDRSNSFLSIAASKQNRALALTYD
jgi:hypothetical protein